MKNIILEKINSLEEMIAVTDNDGHRYQIPQSKVVEWEEFCDIPEDDERSWYVPEWAERIDGNKVTSFKEQVIKAINDLSEDSPMGVSNWLEHGKKYGYLHYLKKHNHI